MCVRGTKYKILTLNVSSDFSIVKKQVTQSEINLSDSPYVKNDMFATTMRPEMKKGRRM